MTQLSSKDKIFYIFTGLYFHWFISFLDKIIILLSYNTKKYVELLASKNYLFIAFFIAKQFSPTKISQFKNSTLPLHCFAALEFYHDAQIAKNLSCYTRFSNDKKVSMHFTREWNVALNPKRKYYSSPISDWLEKKQFFSGDYLLLEIPISAVPKWLELPISTVWNQCARVECTQRCVYVCVNMHTNVCKCVCLSYIHAVRLGT